MIFDLGFVSLFPSVAFQGLVDQVWIDGSGNDFIISPSFADWANCRRIFTISKASGLLHQHQQQEQAKANSMKRT